MARYARYRKALTVFELKGRLAVCECNAAKCVGVAEWVGTVSYFPVTIKVLKQGHLEVEILCFIRPIA